MSNRLGSETPLWPSRYSRTASAPNSPMTSHGFTTFPRLFDIFCPWASSTSSFTTTFRYTVESNTATPIASSE